MKTDYEILMEYALNLISKKRYTQKQLEKKLNGTGGDISKIIARLKEYKYINDEQYAKDYIENRIKLSPRGKRLIVIELIKKGIQKDLAVKTAAKTRTSEFELAMAVLKRKHNILKKLAKQKRKEKIFTILASKGFDFDTIYKAAGEW